MAFSEKLVHRVDGRLEAEAPPEIQAEQVLRVRLQPPAAQVPEAEPPEGFLD